MADISSDDGSLRIPRIDLRIEKSIAETILQYPRRPLRTDVSLPCLLPHFDSVLVAGADARTFLQGQLSLDMTRLTPARMELATCNSAQGRVQAIVWMVERADGIALIVPTELREALISRLRKYVLRAKVTFATNALIVAGTSDTGDLGAQRVHKQTGSISRVRWPGDEPRALLLLPAGQQVNLDEERAQAWRLEDIRAGLPQIFTQTHEAFVAQMLNADLLEGISFEKGCYTGQEIIARAHFRGTVKRRMFRFGADCVPPAPGSRVISEDASHAGDVVAAEASGPGCELLAVINLAQRDAALRIDGVPEGALRKLPLPYEVTSE